MSSTSKGKGNINHTFAALSWVRDLNVSTGEKSVLYSISSRIGSDYTAWPSRKKLCQDAGIKSLATVSKITQSLEDKGLIKIIKRIKDDGAQTSNQYCLLVPPQYKHNCPPSKKQYGLGTKSVLKQSNENYPPNYEGGKEPLKEETSDAPSASPGCASDSEPVASGEDLKIYVKYAKNTHSAKAMACFWWDLLEHYHPGSYSPNKKLTKAQFNALMEILKVDDPAALMYIIETAVRDWHRVKKLSKQGLYPSPPPKSPTITWINKNLDICCSYVKEKYANA